MKKLREKTFYTIFLIISTFIMSAVLVFNIQSYQKEYSGIENNLRRMAEVVNTSPRPDNIRLENDKEKFENGLENRIIMDYEVYTILLDKDNNIIDTISHSENNISDDLLARAMDIIADHEKSEIKINCLYFHNMAYRFNSGNFLVLIDTSNIQKRLLSMLMGTIILLIVFEGLVYYFSKKLTDWITKPVEESFNKQKEFIANASHELKTPLAVMMASIDCLEVNKKNEKWINHLKTESDRMNLLITRLLDLSKSENSVDREVYTWNNLSKIVEKRSLTFEGLAFEKKVFIVNEIEKDVMLQCNPVDMDELIGILIDNAIKHSFLECPIQVRLYQEKHHVIIEIVNQGEEILAFESEKIFERFYRCDKSRNRDSNRYGLGLAIAKNIVNNHDGEIKAFSENGYTTFRVVFKR